MDDGVACKRGLAEERGEFGVALMQTRRAVLHAPAEIQLVERRTDRGMPGQAIVAVATMGEGHHHMIADRDAGDVGTDLLDHTGTFVSKHHRIRGNRQVTSHRVGMAHAGGHHPDQNLV